MADGTSKMDGGSKEAYIKYPMRRLELSIKKFIKVLSIDLERLKKHAINIARLTKFDDWAGLHKEQVNATRTVQQINVNIREIEKARNQVIDDDLSEFDERINPIKAEAVASMADLVAFIGHGPKIANRNKDPVETGTGDIDLDSLLKAGTARVPSANETLLNSDLTTTDTLQHQLNTMTVKEATLPVNKRKGNNPKVKNDPYAVWQATSSTPDAANAYHDGTDGSNAMLSADIASQTQIEAATPLLTTSLHVSPQDSQACASWQELQESILDLNTLVHDFASHVDVQGENVDAIDDHIEQAGLDVVTGTSHLAKASKYKSVLFPVVGAVVGGVVGGPIGLLAGMKIGGMAGVIGGAVGLASGSFYKKRQDKITNIEMSNMNVKRSQSLPDFVDQENAESASSDEIQVEDKSKSQSLGQVNFDKFLSYFTSSSTPTEDEKKTS